MVERASFIIETVVSHPSKVELVARATGLGHLVHLHVVMVPSSLPVARVVARVAGGVTTSPTRRSGIATPGSGLW